MAHTCPECGLTCHCSGDIDDINFGPLYGCCHCDPDEDDDYYDDYYSDALSSLDDPDGEAEDNNPNDSRNL